MVDWGFSPIKSSYRSVAVTSMRAIAGQSVEILRAAGTFVSRWVQMAIEQSLSCRECDAEVNFFERVCPCCGAYGPARVPFQLAAMLMLVPLLFLCAYFGLR